MTYNSVAISSSDTAVALLTSLGVKKTAFLAIFENSCLQNVMKAAQFRRNKENYLHSNLFVTHNSVAISGSDTAVALLPSLGVKNLDS